MMKPTDQGRALAVLATAEKHAADLVDSLGALRRAIEGDMLDDADKIVDGLVRVRAKARKAAAQTRELLP